MLPHRLRRPEATGVEGEDLKAVLDMLQSARMEDRFRLLRAGTLLSELRSAVSLVHTDATVSRGSSPRLTFCARSLATPLLELLEAVLLAEVGGAVEWRQLPAALLRYLDFRKNAIRELRQFSRKFSSLASYAKQELSPLLVRDDDSSSLYSASALARTRDALREPMVGRSHLLEKMVGILLTDRTGDRVLLVVPIVGGPGIGKTRLAKAILDDARVKRKFRVRLVVPVTQAPSVERILMLMVPPERRADAHCSPQTMGVHIRNKLGGGEEDYLIVFDDVWSDNQGKWQELGTVMNALPPSGTVILTTRTPDIASKLASFRETTTAVKTFYLQPLGQEFSSSFVARWMATRHADWPAELVREAGTRIAAKCGGVPFLLDSARRIFCQPLDMQFWQRFLNNKIHPDMLWRDLLLCLDHLPSDEFWQQQLLHSREPPGGKNVVLESASSSYQHLPADLRSCFLYCSMFPSDYDFGVQELADLLTAQGYIPPIVLESLRKGFLQQLLDECFYPQQEHGYGDKFSYRMHKVLHIFAQNMDREISSVIRVSKETQVTTEAKAQSTIRRASLTVHPLTASFPTSLCACKDLGALILLQGGPMCPPELPRCEIAEVPVFVYSFMRMHTLSLRATKIRILPTKFSEAQYVKYLNLSQTDIENIPGSISRLSFLQTLILSHCDKLQKVHPNTTKLAQLQKLDLEGCCSLVELPQDLGKMKSLEYLNITECSSLTQLPHGMGQLKGLQILLGYIVSYTDGSSMSELQPLANLHRLSMQSLEKVLDPLDARYAGLQNKTKLESLSLQWNIDGAKNTTLAYAVLESFQPHRCLKALEIISYEGNMLPSWMTVAEPYLEYLVEIKLINLRLCEGLLDPLGLLPCLKITEISGNETVCSINDRSYGRKGTFRSLEKLTFSYMDNLEIWEQARAGIFPRLTELAIIQCPKLRALHMELPSLEKLTLWMNNKVLYDLKGALRGVAKSLEHISISFSEELVASSDCEGLQDLDKLTKLQICGCDELTCLPQGMKHLSSIRSLTIDNCSKLKTLPDWLESLPSLQIMRLSCCPELHYIPRGLQQRPDIIIYVEDCPNLQEQIPNFPAQPSGKPVAARRNKGKEIVVEDG